MLERPCPQPSTGLRRTGRRRSETGPWLYDKSVACKCPYMAVMTPDPTWEGSRRSTMRWKPAPPRPATAGSPSAADDSHHPSGAVPVWQAGSMCGSGRGGFVWGGALVSEAAVEAAGVPAFDVVEDRGPGRGVGVPSVPVTSSFSRVAKKDSARALSQHTPVRPMESRTSWRVARRAKAWLVYRVPRSEWKITGPAGRRCRQAVVSASAARLVPRWSAVDQPTTRREAMSMTVAR